MKRNKQSLINYFIKSLIITLCIFNSGYAYSQDTTLVDSLHIKWCDYSPEKHNINGGTAKILPPDPLPPNAELLCGSIKLTFMDVVNGTSYGFDDPTLGSIRRNCVCATMNYIQSVINFPASITPTTPVEILFDVSVNNTSPTLAFATPVFPPAFFSNVSGYYSGYVYDYITTGINPAPVNQEHGMITVNFNKSYSYCSPTIGDCEFDFQSIILHEFTHLLGMGSLITENAGLLESAHAPNIFTEFDNLFLYYQQGTSFLKLADIVAYSGNGGINPALPANMFTTYSLYNKVWLDNTPLTNKTNQPIYSRYNFSPGTSLSHFDESYYWRTNFSPAFSPNYVMNGTISTASFKNQFTKEDLRMLDIMGYSVNTSVITDYTNTPPNLTGAVIQNNYNPFPEDPAPAGNTNLVISTTNCNPVTIDISNNIITNGTTSHSLGIYDIDGDPLSVFDGQLFNLRGCGNGGNNNNQLSINASNNIITYTPRTNFVGRAQFAFHLYDGKDRGAYITVTMDVSADNCFNNGTEHVINGNLEDGMLVRSLSNPNSTVTSDGIDAGYHYILNRFVDGQQFLTFGWQDQYIRESYKNCLFGSAGSSFPSPGSVPIPNGNLGDRYTHFSIIENFHQRLQPEIEMCNNYILTFDVSFQTGSPTSAPLTMSLRNSVGGTDLYNFPSGLTNITNLGAGIWQTITIPFSYSNIIPSYYLFTNPNGAGGIIIDNISIIKNPTNPSNNPNVVATASLYTICSGQQSSTLTASGASTYTWSPATGLSATTGSTVTATPSVTTIYTATGTDANGCSATDTVIVNVTTCSTNPDCALPTTLTIPTSGATSSTFPIPNGSVVDVLGNFTINNNVTYTGVKFRMASGTQIDILTGNTLTLSTCHLFSCTQLWEEINVPNGANLIVKSYSIIEDAKIAINWVNGGTVKTENSIFNKNGAGLALSNTIAIATNNIDISNTVFTCRDFPSLVYTVTINPFIFNLIKAALYNDIVTFAPYSSLLSPAPANTRSLYGVYSNRIETTIGSAGSINIANLFDYLDYGISVNHASFNVINNRFANCFGDNSGTNPVGVGVFALTKDTNRIYIGGNIPNQGNTFRNCYRGAHIDRYLKVDFINNKVLNTQTSPNFSGTGSFIGHYGLAIFTGLNLGSNTVTDFHINKNTINNCETGMYINRNWNNIETIALEIHDNNIDVTGSGTYCNRGLWIQDVVGNTAVSTLPTAVNVQNNTIKNCEINAMLFDNVKRSLLVRDNNELSVKLSAPQSRQVIRLNACDYGVVRENTNIKTTNNTTIPVGATQSNFIAGIWVTQSPNCGVICNEVNYVDVCVLFDQPSPNSNFTRNTMDKARIGFVLANGGEIGTQGSPTSPSGNRWGAFNSSHINLYHTYTFNTFNANTNSVMYCRPNTSPCSFGTFKWFPCVNQTFNFSGIDNYLSGSGLQTSTGLTLACATIVVGPPALKMADVVNSITDNSANGNFAQNIRFKQKRFGFTSTKEDNTGTLMSNSTINNFYTQTQPQNIGLLSTTEDLINQKQYSSAKINNLVSPVNNTVEANYQLIYDKVLEQLVDTGYVYTTSDIAQIESVAQLCIQENGEAVTMARALLASIKKEGVSYNNDCIEIPFDNNGNRLMQQEETTNSVSEVSDVLIYPNPNKGTFTVQYETNEEEQLTLTIVELTGKIVHQETLPVGFQEKEIITENIGTGFYFITIKTKSGILTYSTKMSIVK